MGESQDRQWLLEQGGPVIRWRTVTELGGDIPVSETASLAQKLADFPLVQEWISRLTLADFPVPLDAIDSASLRWLGNKVHGGKAACLENVFGKLAEFGLRAGLPGLDERALMFLPIFRWQPEWKSDTTFLNAWENLVKSVFAWGLLRLGYTPDAPMAEFLRKHLENCHKIARDRVYDLYADENELIGLPKAWVGKPILKQEVMANYWLPYIHDFYVFAHWPSDMLDETARKMIDDILAYILDPRFQALHEGYGYAWIKERRTCYGWGWSPHLPGYPDPEQAAKAGKNLQGLVRQLELMVHFASLRDSLWLHESLRFLEGFRTSEGRYCFPAEFLRESEGYYVSGYGMGLGENRRKSNWVEIESTFRMLKIQTLLKRMES